MGKQLDGLNIPLRATFNVNDEPFCTAWLRFWASAEFDRPQFFHPIQRRV
jgi:hypothetical protein